MKRDQSIVVIKRKSDGLFYHAQKMSHSPSWTKDIRLANVVGPTKVKGLIRANWGRDMEDYEAVPVVPVVKKAT